VTPLLKGTAELLRSALREAHGRFKSVYEEERSRLEASDSWKKIKDAQRRRILEDEGIAEVPALSIGGDDDLVRSLDRTPLTSWAEKTDALSQRFANAAMKAAKLLAPKVQKHKPTSGILKTPAEVKAWVASLEKDLLKKLDDGPIVIG
jgi:hypothetical protein